MQKISVRKIPAESLFDIAVINFSIVYFKRLFSFVLGDKYEAVSMDSGYNKYMMLKIRSASKGDFGSYKCVAKNSLGETDGVIKLDGKLYFFSATAPSGPGLSHSRGFYITHNDPSLSVGLLWTSDYLVAETST
jgi:hypothetical protein